MVSPAARRVVVSVYARTSVLTRYVVAVIAVEAVRVERGDAHTSVRGAGSYTRALVSKVTVGTTVTVSTFTSAVYRKSDGDRLHLRGCRWVSVTCMWNRQGG